jgi:putative cardiolipin synthase
MNAIFLLMRRNSLISSLFILILTGVLQGCSSIPDNSNMERTTALENTGDTALDKMVAKEALENNGKSGAILLSSGLDAFVARAALSVTAEKSLDIQYYLFHDDTIGKLLIDQIVKAADRGVKVRLLLDDIDLEGKDKSLLVLDSHPNINIRVFNPFDRNFSRIGQFATRLGDVTRRMHNKMFIADSSMVILGGRNIGDEYFDINPDRAFSDLDVLLTGEVVSQASIAFDLYWNSEVVYPISLLVDDVVSEDELNEGRTVLFALTHKQSKSAYAQALLTSNFMLNIKEHGLTFTWLDADIFYDHPLKVRRARSKREYHLTKDLEPYFKALKEELLIITPYFVNGKEGMEFLTALADKGIEVTIITNSLASNDVLAVHSGYARYRERLLKKGISLYEIKPKVNALTNEGEKKKSSFGSSKTSLHAKSFVLDKENVFIGSLNLDPRSAYENTEVGTVINSSFIGSSMVNFITDNIVKMAFKVTLHDGDVRWTEVNDNKIIVHNNEPYTVWWQRLSVKMLQWLPIESQL